jgi:hypothetical protein
MDAAAVVEETRVGASAEIGGDDVASYLGARAHVARDLTTRIALGVEAAWAIAGWSRTAIGGEEHVLVGRQKGRALVYVELRTPPARAEGAVAFGSGIAGERLAEEHIDGSRRWLAIAPSYAVGAWGSGRIWLSSSVAIEIDAGAVVTNEPPGTYGTSRYRAVLSPFVRAGLVARF